MAEDARNQGVNRERCQVYMVARGAGLSSRHVFAKQHEVESECERASSVNTGTASPCGEPAAPSGARQPD
jgi:hypothetical protein